jgi:hypothetical protein
MRSLPASPSALMLKANVAAWRRRRRARHLKPAAVREAAE